MFMATRTLEPTTLLPPTDIEAMGDLSRFLDRIPEPAALLGPDGQTVPLPIEVYHVLTQVVTAMRSGKAITVASLEQTLTTQEAADYLGISRPTLVKLLEMGRIPFDQPGPGRHRRVRLADLIDYRDANRQKRRQALSDLSRDAAATGLYDEGADSYRDAVTAARKQH